MNDNEYYKSCDHCGRPMVYCKGQCCGKTQGCQCKEYGPKVCGAIRPGEPKCPYQAVIPSLTVESVSNLKDLADCFVHVSGINTTFYIDDKHRIMTTWAGLVSVDDYDFEANPLNLRSQIAYDSKNNVAAIYDKQGANYIFQISDINNNYMLLENKPQINGVTLEGNKTSADLGILEADEVALVFDTVADMKVATSLADGGYARTLGFHSINDGGGALYKITNTGTANEMDIIAVGSLFANLQHKDSVFIKQLGAYGDNTHDDTAVLDRCLAIVDHVIINKSASPYLAKYIKLNEGKSLEGEALPYVQINLSRSGSAVVPRFYSNTSMDKIYLNSLDANLSNNRLDLRDSNIRITNSRIEGFRADNRNAWGILLTGAKNVVIDNCYFKNNTQSDIALVEGCENVTISNCNGDSFHINVEPQYEPKMYNIKFDQCNIAKLDLRENQYVYDTCISFTVTNCTIDLLEYDGANTTFIDCVIKDIQQQPSPSVGAGGQVKFINSLNMGKNLVDDVYLDTFDPVTNSSNEWHLTYSPIGVQLALSMAKVNNEPVLTLHPAKDVKRTITIQHQPISVSTNQIYMLRIGASADYTPTGTANISRAVVIRCYDSSNEQIAELSPSMFRGAEGSIVPMHEETWFFKVPENTDHIVLMFRNANYGAQSFSIRSCELYEVGSSEIVKNEVATPAVRHNRVYHGNAVYTNINNDAGDIMYYKTPTAGGNIGQVCITGGYPSVWKSFGSIAS